MASKKFGQLAVATQNKNGNLKIVASELQGEGYPDGDRLDEEDRLFTSVGEAQSWIEENLDTEEGDAVHVIRLVRSFEKRTVTITETKMERLDSPEEYSDESGKKKASA